ncbi:MAG: acetoin utilization protein AcuC [Magnetococcales bacterium]|nr:acetoin utilization protein AcuC [Magnetococcales bacterium]MBF0156070.1 acetoin utilization protein AcuC [Magnetococcales bacterium]
MSATVRVYVGREIADYGFGNGHPFGPHRMDAFWNEARRRGLDRQVEIGKPVAATREVIELFHTPEYVAQVIRQSRTGEGLLDYGDTPAFKGVYEAASHVVGSTVDGTEAIMKKLCRRVFVPIAGLHHARPERAGGFCVFNDVGVAIGVLRRDWGLERIAYVDIDAHHGDGVFYAFESDPEVFIADIHEDGRFLYPGTGHSRETGEGEAQGTKLNIPMMPGANQEDFLQAWEAVEKFIRATEPEFIFLQVGADSIAGDPITHLGFTAKAHGHAAERLTLLAEELGHGRIVGVGGGGYNVTNIGHGWSEVVEAFVRVPVTP